MLTLYNQWAKKNWVVEWPKVSAVLNGKQIGTSDTASPYQISWLPDSAGTYQIVAVVIDAVGRALGCAGVDRSVGVVTVAAGVSALIVAVGVAAAIGTVIVDAAVGRWP